jgi:hypothetical protein
MGVEREWLRAEADRLGLALTDEDLAAIGQAVSKTRTELAGVRPASPDESADTPVGFLPISLHRPS